MADLRDYPDLQRRETPEHEEQLRSALFTSFAQTDALHANWQSFEVLGDTALAGDDAATPYEPVSQWLGTLIGVAFDNLRTVKLIMQDAETVPVAAHFGLLRNAIEAAGVRLWLIGPDSRDSRVLRGLQLAYENRKDEHSLNATIEGIDIHLPADDPAVLRLAEIRDMRPGIRGRTLNPPSITDRLKAAQGPTDNYPFSLLVTWKLTSGIAHGRRAAMYHLLDREVTATTERGASIWMTSSFGSISGTYRITLHYLMRLLTLALRRNGTRLSI